MAIEEGQLIEPRDGLFLVERASLGMAGPPCDEAVKVRVVNVDVRTTDDPRKVPAYKGDAYWWFSEGKNHRVVDGQITRDRGHVLAWAVEIADLDALMAFMERHGDIIIYGPRPNGHRLIKIYDDYAE